MFNIEWQHWRHATTSPTGPIPPLLCPSKHVIVTPPGSITNWDHTLRGVSIQSLCLAPMRICPFQRTTLNHGWSVGCVPPPLYIHPLWTSRFALSVSFSIAQPLDLCLLMIEITRFPHPKRWWATRFHNWHLNLQKAYATTRLFPGWNYITIQIVAVNCQ